MREYILDIKRIIEKIKKEQKDLLNLNYTPIEIANKIKQKEEIINIFNNTIRELNDNYGD